MGAPLNPLQYRTTDGNYNTSSSVSPTSTTTYIVKDSSSTTMCVDTASITIDVIASPDITGRDTIVTSGSSVDLSTLITGSPEGTLEYGLSLNDFSISKDVAPDVRTTYYVRDSNTTTMCVDTAQITVFIIVPNISIFGPDVVCQDQTSTYSSSSVALFDSVKWTYFGDGLLSVVNDSTVNVNYDGNFFPNGSGSLLISGFVAQEEVADTLDISFADPLVCNLLTCDREELYISDELMDQFVIPSDIMAIKSISSDAHLSDGHQFSFMAGDSIVLMPDFEVVLGTQLQIILESCTEALMELREGAHRDQSQEDLEKLKLILSLLEKE